MLVTNKSPSIPLSFLISARDWRTKDYQDIAKSDISQRGIFEMCEITERGLILEVNYDGRKVSGTVASNNVNAPGNLYKLRDFLLDHTGESMATIEALDVEVDQFKHP